MATSADDLTLFPRPRRLEATGANVHAPTMSTRTAWHPSLPEQGYELTIGAQGVDISHADDLGLRYAHATLDQIVEQCAGGDLPGLRVSDHPDFAVRGYMLDVSRTRVPTRATLERLVGLCALARLNHLELYTEHTFAYRDHEVVWRDASPITPDDVHWLDRHCARRTASSSSPTRTASVTWGGGSSTTPTGSGRSARRASSRSRATR